MAEASGFESKLGHHRFLVTQGCLNSSKNVVFRCPAPSCMSGFTPTLAVQSARLKLNGSASGSPVSAISAAVARTECKGNHFSISTTRDSVRTVSTVSPTFS